MICDPLALQHVLQGYKYPRPVDLKFLLKGFLGSGIIYSEGLELFFLVLGCH